MSNKYYSRRAYNYTTFFYQYIAIRVGNTSMLTQNNSNFADDKSFSFIKTSVFFIKSSLLFTSCGQSDNNTSLVSIMTWRRTGNKQLSKPMMAFLLAHLRVTRPRSGWTPSTQYTHECDNERRPISPVNHYMQKLSWLPTRATPQLYITNHVTGDSPQKWHSKWIYTPMTWHYLSKSLSEQQARLLSDKSYGDINIVHFIDISLKIGSYVPMSLCMVAKRIMLLRMRIICYTEKH